MVPLKIKVPLDALKGVTEENSTLKGEVGGVFESEGKDAAKKKLKKALKDAQD